MSSAPPSHQVLKSVLFVSADFHFKAMRKASLRSRPSSYGRQPRVLKTSESNPVPLPKLQGFPRKITLAFFHVGFCNFLILISLSQRTQKKKMSANAARKVLTAQ